MVAAPLRYVRGRLCQRSDPEPIGGSAESNQPHVIPLGADNSGYQIVGFWSPGSQRSVPSSKPRNYSPQIPWKNQQVTGFRLPVNLFFADDDQIPAEFAR